MGWQKTIFIGWRWFKQWIGIIIDKNLWNHLILSKSITNIDTVLFLGKYI
jgi:hypothetical protein